VKLLLTLTAAIEAATGLALLVAPAFVVQVLLGDGIKGAAIPLGRVAGVVLLALGVACWLAREDRQGRTARGVVAAMSLYNIGATSVLGTAGWQSLTAGIVLWLAVMLHAALAIWCLALILFPRGPDLQLP